MAKDLILGEVNNLLSFGDYTLPQKQKLEDFPFGGDLYKVKTFHEITKLEKNGMFLYESVPGTTVEHFRETEKGVSFRVLGAEDAQITLGLSDDTTYNVTVNGENVGEMATGLGGKLNISVELSEGGSAKVEVVKK